MAIIVQLISVTYCERQLINCLDIAIERKPRTSSSFEIACSAIQLAENLFWLDGYSVFNLASLWALTQAHVKLYIHETTAHKNSSAHFPVSP